MCGVAKLQRDRCLDYVLLHISHHLDGGTSLNGGVAFGVISFGSSHCAGCVRRAASPSLLLSPTTSNRIAAIGTRS